MTTDKSKFVPKLRFPEFANCGEWEKKELSSVAISVKKKAKKGIPHRILTLSSEYGIISQDDYFGRQIASENTDRYIEVKENDFIYNDRITKESKYGTMRRLSRYSDGIVSPIYKCFRFNENETPSFWEYYFSTALHDSEYKKLANEGARGGRYNISVDKLLTSHVLTPKSDKDNNEQQRIADCLSSLDTLINAQSEKVEKLKSHKKGLLQKLFPQEGQNLPEYRFPEFKDCGEWEEVKLDEILNYEQPTNYIVESTNYSESYNIPVLTANKAFILGYTNETTGIYSDFPVIIFDDFTTDFKYVDFVFKVKSSAIKILSSKKNDIRFIFESMKNIEFSIGTHKRHWISEFSQKTIQLPKGEKSLSEQQKIADCLSSLDELIDKHSQKLESLKAHKKGLMQGLFPCEG